MSFYFLYEYFYTFTFSHLNFNCFKIEFHCIFEVLLSSPDTKKFEIIIFLTLGIIFIYNIKENGFSMALFHTFCFQFLQLWLNNNFFSMK